MTLSSKWDRLLWLRPNGQQQSDIFTSEKAECLHTENLLPVIYLTYSFVTGPNQVFFFKRNQSSVCK